jgi:carbon storage regulator CsrA
MEDCAMLVLNRKIGESIRIGADVTLMVVKLTGNRVTLGIDAPTEVRVMRGELMQFIHAACNSECDMHNSESHAPTAAVSS